MNTMKTQKNITLITFLAIPVSLLLLFVLYPLVKLMQLSMTDWDGVSQGFNFIGVQNYLDLFGRHPEVWTSLQNNWTYFWVHGIFIPLELIIAMVLDSKIRGSRFFKSIILMPYIINGVAIAYIFSFFYASEGGALNAILHQFGLDFLNKNWLSDLHIVNYSLVWVSLWRYSGFHIILFLAGLQSIPQELFETATVDGANLWQRLQYVIIPSIATVIEIVLFLNIRGALQVFDIPFLITKGGPGYASSTFTLYTVDTAFNFNSFGAASAMGINLLVLIVIFSCIQNKVFNLKREQNA